MATLEIPSSPYEHADIVLEASAGLEKGKDFGSNNDHKDAAGVGTRFAERSETINTASDSERYSDRGDMQEDSEKLEKPRTRTLGKLKMRSQYDHDPTDWWFASTAIPLVAATFAPMANLLSIAALVVYWRNIVEYPDDPLLKYSQPSKVTFKDPRWCFDLNAVSLVCGFLGNLFLLFNFTQRVRYIIALPVTIFFFYLAAGILIGIIVSMNQYAPPSEDQVYSQGYWHAVIAACLYLLNSMILMVNMAGYFLGHYPQHFTLTDEQRNLILQTMLFFIWLGGWSGIFARIEQWSYPDALYFCDVTILTIGFGDYYATRDVTRGLVFPFSVGGTIILGLMVNSIHKFARELSKEKVVRKHVEQRRKNTLSRAVTLDELDDRDLSLLATGNVAPLSNHNKQYDQHHLDGLAQQEREKRRNVTFEDGNSVGVANIATLTHIDDKNGNESPSSLSSPRRHITQSLIHAMTLPITKPISMTSHGLRKAVTRRTKKILMIEERDRFNAMRRVQRSASVFHRYYALTMSIIAFGMLWCLGAMVFYFAEAETQRLNYFQGLYFCYVSLLTIGYGDLSPKSNAGKSFFVFWSLIAVPTMTILVSDLGDTVIGGFKRGVLQNDFGLTSSSRPTGRTSKFFHRVMRAAQHIKGGGDKPKDQTNFHSEHDSKYAEDLRAKDMNMGGAAPLSTIDDLVEQDLSQPEMLKKLAIAIKSTAEDIRNEPGKQYRYEDWVEFTRLIRFSRSCASRDNDVQVQLEYDEDSEGIVEWDWLDDRSPMTSEQTESEWVLDRLCESLLRIFNRGDVLVSLLSGVRSPNSATAQSPTKSRIQTTDSSATSRQSGQVDNADKTKSMSAMTRLIQGGSGTGGLKWSKRGHARNTLLHHNDVKRRNSSKTTIRRQNLLASQQKKSEVVL